MKTMTLAAVFLLASVFAGSASAQCKGGGKGSGGGMKSQGPGMMSMQGGGSSMSPMMMQAMRQQAFMQQAYMQQQMLMAQEREKQKAEKKEQRLANLKQRKATADDKRAKRVEEAKLLANLTTGK